MTRRASGGAISQRALNRAILARQFLLARQGASALETIRHLGGMQAQAPRSPHVGLWTRLTDEGRAFGPASVLDAQVWSGLTRLGEVFERLRSRLVTFTDSAGRELFDLPDAPRPDEDVEAPVRYLPEFDNLLLSHDDRSRVNPVGLPPPIPPGNGGTSGTVLVDGCWRADWKPSQDDGAAIVTVTAHERLTRTDKAEVRAEGHRMLAFLAPDAERTDVRF